jgi:DNA-directed RNA polymerase subunit RPC12/RpoP
VCARCAPALTPADEAEETTCDKCRTRVPLIHPRSITVGPLVYAYGLCPNCAETEPDGHAPDRPRRRRARR